MAFSESCVIWKSTPSLWRRLIGFGLRQGSDTPKLEERNKNNQMCVVVADGIFFTMRLEDVSDGVFDCGSNEDLFFALAAMRDDTDIHQWFIYDNRSWNDDNPIRAWHRCKTDKLEDDLVQEEMYQDCEKATRMEIIAHFTGMDDDELLEDVYE